jgi:hypothetical protein
MGQLVMGVAGIILNVLALIPYYQSGFLTESYNGAWVYPLGGQGTLQLVTGSAKTQNGYLVTLSVVGWANIAFSLVGAGVALKDLLKEKRRSSDSEKEDLSMVGGPGISKRHLAISWLSLLGLGCGLVQICSGFLIYGASALPFSLFQNQMGWLYLLMVVGIHLPIGTPREQKALLSEDFRAATSPLPLLSAFWLTGSLFGLGLGLYCLVETGIWRTQNGLTAFCPGEGAWNKTLLFFPSSSVNPDPDYAIQLVRWTESSKPDSMSPKKMVSDLTCLDDVVNFIVIIIGFINLALGIALFCCPPKEIEEKLRQLSSQREADLRATIAANEADAVNLATSKLDSPSVLFEQDLRPNLRKLSRPFVPLGKLPLESF